MASRTLFLTVLLALIAFYSAADVPCLPPVENPDTDTILEVALVTNANSGIPVSLKSLGDLDRQNVIQITSKNVDFLFSQVQCALQERYSKPKFHRWHISGDDCTILESDSAKLNTLDQHSDNFNGTDPTTLCETLDALENCVENIASASNMRVVMALADVDSVKFTECGIFHVKNDRFRHFSSSAYDLKTAIFRFCDEVVTGLPSNLVVLPLNEDRDMDPPDGSKFELSDAPLNLLEKAKSQGRMFATEMYDHFYALKRVANGLTPYVMPTTTSAPTESTTELTTTLLETTMTTQMPTEATTKKHLEERMVELNLLEDIHNATDTNTVVASSTTPAPITTTETPTTIEPTTNATTEFVPTIPITIDPQAITAQTTSLPRNCRKILTNPRQKLSPLH